MAQTDVWKRYLDAGTAFTELTRARAESIIKDLVKAGEIPRKRAEASIDELVDRSRKNTETILALVQAAVQEQLGALGLATKADIARLEAQIKAAGGKAAAATKAPAKKAPAKKAAAKKAPATKQA